METDELGWPDTGSRRCFGYFGDKDTAIQAVTENWCDINETCYDYAVIEHIEPGIHPIGDEQIWFQFDYDDRAYHWTEKPDAVKGTINFALG